MSKRSSDMELPKSKNKMLLSRRIIVTVLGLYGIFTACQLGFWGIMAYGMSGGTAPWEFWILPPPYILLMLVLIVAFWIKSIFETAELVLWGGLLPYPFFFWLYSDIFVHGADDPIEILVSVIFLLPPLAAITKTFFLLFRSSWTFSK